jgi:prephenate dehydrogenase/chorismate mutase/prephenate dehydrogenase
MNLKAKVALINQTSQSTNLSTSTDLQQQQVTIVGGGGRMGRFFSSCLSQAGHQVNILEYSDWGQAKKLLTDIDLVLLCVPIECMVKTIAQLSQYLSPHTALADITSIKAPIVKAMLEYHQGPVMGLHPMFGPDIKSFLAQKVVICPGRQDIVFQWFLELMQSDGAELIYATPKEHDRMMTTVQAIRHFATFSLGAFLSQENIDIERSLDFSSPKYRQQIEMVQRLFAQSAPLVVDIMLATPESREAIARLGNTYSGLAKLIQQGDRDALINEFRATDHFFQRLQKSAIN